MMTNSSYILADDLSGALETGAAFRARGWRVTLPLDPRAIGACGEGGIEIVSTETRAAAPARAARIVRDIVTARAAAGSRLLFKKIDSTLRGPIGAEITAIIAALEPPLVVVCPANPAVRRTVRDGVLFVDGRPLAETEFRNDPQWPASGSRVGERLEAHGLAPIWQLPLDAVRAGSSWESLSATMAAGGRILIADAETQDDIGRIVAAVREVGPNAVMMGSGAVGAAIAEQLPHGGQPLPKVRFDDCRRVLILCGSAHPASHAQLDHLAKHSKVAVIPFVAGESDGRVVRAGAEAAMDARGVAAVRFTVTPDAFADPAGSLQTAIGGFVRSFVAHLSPDLLVLTGGETAWTVCRAIEGVHLEVVSEFQPGVVLSQVDSAASRPPLVVTKPGGFGSRDSFSSILPSAVK